MAWRQPSRRVGGTLIATSLVLKLLWWYATVNHRLIDPDLDPRLIRVASERILLPIPVYLLSIGFAFVNTTLSLVIYALVSLLYYIPLNRVDRVWVRSRE